MNKLMYTFVATRKKKKKKKKKKEIDPFLDTVCPLRASRVIIYRLGLCRGLGRGQGVGSLYFKLNERGDHSFKTERRGFKLI